MDIIITITEIHMPVTTAMSMEAAAAATDMPMVSHRTDTNTPPASAAGVVHSAATVRVAAVISSTEAAVVVTKE